jgi:hypothetical protein
MRLPTSILAVTLGIAVREARADTATLTGPSGLLHVPSARIAAPGAIHAALFVGGFRASDFLCTIEAPCTRLQTGGAHRATYGHAFVGGVPFRGVELYLGTRVANHRNTATDAPLDVFGDVTFGGKWARPIADRVDLGVDTQISLAAAPSGGWDLAATSARLRGLATVDLPRLRLHGSLGYFLDQSGRLGAETETARSLAAGRPRGLTRVERFSLAIEQADRIELGFGAESELVRRVRPFAEATLAIPVDRRRSGCREGAVAPADQPDADRCLGDRSSLARSRSKVTLGLRVSPWSTTGGRLDLLAAFDLGLLGTSTFVSQLVPQAPWTAWAGIGFALTATGPTPAPTPTPASPTPLVRIRGTLRGTDDGRPIAGAIITFGNDAHPPLSTDAAGRFGARVEPGTYELKIEADGRRPGRCGGTAVVPRGAREGELLLDCTLEPEPPASPDE